MQFIHTTATTVDKLKRQAKAPRKTSGSSLAVELDNVAKQNGYDHWKHVIYCQAKTKESKLLPSKLSEFLKNIETEQPALIETKNAFANGFVFAMDVKDAQELSLTEEYVACHDGWYIAAKDLWYGLIYYKEDDMVRTLAESREPEELLEIATEDMCNFRMYRFTGIKIPSTLSEAFECITELSFFAPTHIWLMGKFIDISEVKEIKIDGKVVMSNSNVYHR